MKCPWFPCSNWQWEYDILEWLAAWIKKKFILRLHTHRPSRVPSSLHSQGEKCKNMRGSSLVTVRLLLLPTFFVGGQKCDERSMRGPRCMPIFAQCIQGEWRLYSTPSGYLYGNPTYPFITLPECEDVFANITKIQLDDCPAGVSKAYYSACEEYKVCTYGTEVMRSCSPGYVYDDSIYSCARYVWVSESPISDLKISRFTNINISFNLSHHYSSQTA